ncbi:MAG: 3'-5' exonuclease, partial [Eubacteriales bacterium]|nr:3'-5' exonuclease [Eubacteriales bacterium]
DEYQDTNKVQYMLIKTLGKKKSGLENVFVVGDEDQSIYGWRGADINNILDFERDFPSAKVIKLERNYRSSQNILDAANSVIVNNTQRIGKNLWTEDNKGDKIQLYQANSEKTEALHIAERIYNEKNIHRTSYDDIAVLVRTRAQTRAIEERFLLEGIPYTIVGGQEFYGRKEIKDLMAYLKLLQNNHEDYSYRRIINVPKRGIGKKTIETLESYAADKDISLFEASRSIGKGSFPKKATEEINRFYDFIELMSKDKEQMSLYGFVEKTYTYSGYRSMLEKDHTIEGKSKLENVEEFFSKVKDFEERSEENALEDFLAHISLLTDIEKTEETNLAKVSIMTVHSAKGLEFEVIVIAGLEEKMFPIIRESENDMEEERRLFYVAVTRAKKRLYLTYAQDRMIYGRYESRKKSRFIDELPQNLVNSNIKNIDAKSSKTFEPVFTGSYTIPKIETDSTEYLDNNNKIFKIGDKITHKSWGAGTIVQVKGDEITAAFNDKGIKVMMMPYAPIKKL